MLSNKTIIETFLERSEAQNRHMWSTGMKLFSYQTCIAQWKDKDTLIVNTTKYSSITSKQQSILNKAIKQLSDYIKIVQLNTVPKNHVNLLKLAGYETH